MEKIFDQIFDLSPCHNFYGESVLDESLGRIVDNGHISIVGNRICLDGYFTINQLQEIVRAIRIHERATEAHV